MPSTPCLSKTACTIHRADDQGFVAISEYLSVEGSSSDGSERARQQAAHLEGIFAAGDVASCAKHPRPKAGVYAVHQGPPLAANLRRYLAGEQLEAFVPQSTALAIITAGERTYGSPWLADKVATLL